MDLCRHDGCVKDAEYAVHVPERFPEVINTRQKGGKNKYHGFLHAYARARYFLPEKLGTKR